jgi:hypothetical protein
MAALAEMLAVGFSTNPPAFVCALWQPVQYRMMAAASGAGV